MDDKNERLIEEFKRCDHIFNEALKEAKRINQLEITELTSAYLLNLLVRGWRTEKPSEYLGDQTVAELFANGRFREAGDKAMLIAGMWRETLRRKPVKAGYYVSIGSRAYKRESQSTSGVFSDLFKELSLGFGRMASVLRRALHHLPETKMSNPDILRLYEEWIETRNPELANELISLGVILGNYKKKKQ